MNDPGSAFLNVDKSVMLARWMMPPAEMDIVERIARQYDLPEFIARMLAGRNVPLDRIEPFLYPTLAKDFPDPCSLASMEEAAAWLAGAIDSGRKIGVFGDFDVDGATSTAILVRFFRYLGLEVPFYIPDRLKEGYGPNIGALQSLKEQGAEIILMCDCGTTSFDVIAQGAAMGLDIVILDHHEAEEKLPAAKYVINPKRKDDISGLRMLAACGVSFMLCVALNTKLRESGFYEKRGLAEVPIKSLLDLVALGTVCDMVPLVGVNRLLVRSGFEQMAKHKNAGIKALCEVSGVSEAPNAYHAGFMLGPRINAGSRVHKAWLGAKLLSLDDAEEARNIAFTLNDCNDKRKGIEKDMLDSAYAMIEGQGLQERPVIIVGHEDWHPGLSGLVAGRIKERYGRPACVITFAKSQEGIMEGR